MHPGAKLSGNLTAKQMPLAMDYWRGLKISQMRHDKTAAQDHNLPIKGSI
jgi:hypothetical protein